MAGDVGVGPFLPGEACGRDVDGGFLELLLGDRVVGPNVLEAELRDGEVEGLVLRPSRIPSEVEGLDGRYRTRCSGARGFGPARLRTLLIPSLVFQRGFLEVFIGEYVFGENGLHRLPVFVPLGLAARRGLRLTLCAHRLFRTAPRWCVAVLGADGL